MKKYCVILLILSSFNFFSQENTHFCAFGDSDDIPALYKTLNSEYELGSHIKTFKVAFHIIYHISYDQDLNDKVTDQLINNQITMLNRAFSNSYIKFEKGPVSRTQVTTGDSEFFISGNAHTFDELAGIADADHNEFINVWICQIKSDMNEFNQYTHPAGIASEGIHVSPNQACGVVIDGDYFGYKIDDAAGWTDGETLVHEMGHFLGLYHLWRGDGDCSKEADEVDDTPNQPTPYYQCDLESPSCTTGVYAFVENYMGYNSDECRKNFTTGQSLKMHGVIENNHIGLYSVSDILANQVLSTDENFGVLGIWEERYENDILISEFVEYEVPFELSFAANEDKIIKGERNIYSNEKFQSWNGDLSSVLNHNSFSDITAQLGVVSQFRPIIEDVTIKNSYEDASDFNYGSLYFADPWFIGNSSAYSDGTYGKRNLGTAAIFEEVNSPFTPYTDEIWNTGDYQGVFKDIEYNSTKPHYSIKVPQERIVNINGTNRTFYFQNWAGENADIIEPTNLENGYYKTPIVFRNNNASIKANYKGIQLTSNKNSYNGSQNKVINLPYKYNLLTAYESMGKVWLERSSDKGDTWELVNNHSSISGDYESKNPSMCIVDNNRFAVVFQRNISGYNQIVLQVYNVSGSVLTLENEEEIFSDDGGTYSNNVNPVISVEHNSSNNKLYYFIVWGQPYGGYADAGLNYILLTEDTNNDFSFVNSLPIRIIYSNVNSSNPTITSNLVSKTQSEFHLAWEQYYSSSTSKIKYCKISVNSSNSLSYSNYSTPSDGRYSLNYSPSIAITLNRARVAWLTEHPVTFISEAVVRTNGGTSSWGYIRAYTYSGGDMIESVHINNLDENYGFLLAYGGDNREIRYTKGYTTTYEALPTRTNKNVQVSNGAVFEDIILSSVNTDTAPYYFEQNQINFVLNKTSTVKSVGRSANVVLDSTLFYCTLKDIKVDDELIYFPEMDEEKSITNLEVMNDNLFSNKFKIKKNSKFTFKLRYGTTDYLSKESVLIDDKELIFTIELIDSKTNEVISTLTKIKYNNSDKPLNNELAFIVETDDYKTEKAMLKLSVYENLNGLLTIDEITSDKIELPKNGFEEIKLENLELVTDYSLIQNYPNPFNPITTISYTIPKNEFVELVVYDILGKEVSTLVSKHQTLGRYNFTFDGSNLASGIYFYKITAGDFSDTKKLILMK